MAETVTFMGQVKIGFVTSSWLTSVWEWFLGLAARAVQPVLFVTVMYSIASTYPGFRSPGSGFDLAMFIIQNAALDVASFGLPKLADQAEREGNEAGANEARRISKALFWIMISNLIYGGIDHMFPGIPDGVKTAITLIFVIIRAFYAIKYSVVIHGLKIETNIPVNSVPNILGNENEQLSERLAAINEQNERRFQELANTMNEQLRQVAQQLNEQMRATNEQNNARWNEQMEAFSEHFKMTNEQTANTLAGVVQQMGELKRALKTNEQTNVLANKKEQVAHPANPVIEQKTNIVELKQRTKTNTETNTFDKGAFVRKCLAETPNIRNAEIQRKANEQNITLSAGYISDIRKSLTNIENEQTEQAGLA